MNDLSYPKDLNFIEPNNITQLKWISTSFAVPSGEIGYWMPLPSFPKNEKKACEKIEHCSKYSAEMNKEAKSC